MTELTYKLRQAHKDRQERIIDDYAAILECREKGVVLWDVSELPYLKEDIAMALLTKLHWTSDRTEADVYAAAVLTLSDYQSGVGLNAIRLPDPNRVAAATDAASLRSATADMARWEAFKEVVRADFADLRHRVEIARIFNKKLTGSIARAAFKLRCRAQQAWRSFRAG